MIMMKMPATAMVAMVTMAAFAQNPQETGRIREYRAELARLQHEKLAAKDKADRAAEAAGKSAGANREAAEKLTANPKDKSLAQKANKLAKAAQKDARSARKAADDLAEIDKELAGLQSKISDGAGEVAVYPLEKSEKTEMAPAAIARNPAQPPVTAPSITDTIRSVNNVSRIADKVIEYTYKSYPQQPGQPAIIINNIVVPPDYGRATDNARSAQGRYLLSEEEMREFQAFREWLNTRKAALPTMKEAEAAAFREEMPQPAVVPAEPTHKLTFAERFGEIKPRRSGMWVIPVVGVHASSFKADFSNDEAEGRSGWNAGLDFRAHQKRFFVQPGAHYFSSSMDVTSKDSLSNAPLLNGPRIHTLKVPLLAGIYLTRERGTFLKVNLKGGVVGSYVLSVDKNNQTRFTKDNIEEFSWGLNAGLGIELGLLTIDLSHEWGMSPLFKDNNNKSNVLRATLGIKL